MHFLNDTLSAGKLLTLGTTDRKKKTILKNNAFKPCNKRTMWFCRPAKDYKASRKAKLTTCMSDPFTSEKTGEDLFN